MKVGGHSFEISHRDKLLFPDAGLTKGDLVDYYARIADVMLPHVAGRPLTLYRFPEGVGESGFFQKNASDYFPGWIERVRLGKEDVANYCVCRSPADLIYLASQVSTFHIWLSRVDRPDHPDRLIFDLDPGPDTTFDIVRTAAKMLSELLLDLGLVGFLMTTGSRGLHVVAPLDRRADFAAARGFAHGVAELLAARAPEHLTTEQRKSKRGGRLFIDTYRNAYGQTAIAPYAVRAKPGAPIATPLEWDALDDAKLRSDRYGIKNIFRRLGQKQDPWQDIDHHAANLKVPRQRLDRLQRRDARRRA
ncbi:MAG TPA: non-homologous end-joining DNA ligase [Gammaproteobacteria bacterium]|nr:non-homologous end-joining DNA ligase [Gammaproteobacteria bacterium]